MTIPKLTIVRGADLAIDISIPAAVIPADDLFDAVVTSQLRVLGEDTLIETLTCTVPEAGLVRVSWTAAASADWPLTSGTVRAVFDLKINLAGRITRSLPGELEITDGVTE
jgi:hypothetical protein